LEDDQITIEVTPAAAFHHALLALNATLVTRDRDFSGIEHLRVFAA
jgi:predicted nucleic acid-binding protein